MEGGEQLSYCKYEVNKETRVATMTFDKPEKLHAMTPPHDSDEVIDLLNQADRDDNVAVVVMKGSGKCFGAGYDLKSVREVRGFHEEKRPSQRRRWKGVDDWWGRRAILQKMLSFDKVLIAQVHGYCYGGHMEIMFACDLAVASEDATFTHPGYTYLGIEGPIPLYVLTMGWRKVKEMMLIGKTLTAQEALEFGMINRVVPSEKLEEETMEWAEIVGQRPLDGIVVGKKEFLMAMDMMGLSLGYDLASFSHAFMSNLKFGEGEFNLMKELKEGGKKGMYKKRDAKVKRDGDVMKRD
jgi:enoyl-CoA hydratase